MESKEKEKILAERRKVASNVRLEKATMHDELDSCITCFQRKIRKGPYYICCVCNRILYKKRVTQLKKSEYTIQHLFTGQKSFDNKEYICKTYNSKLSKGQVP